jgi:hypothetical protein
MFLVVAVQTDPTITKSDPRAQRARTFQYRYTESREEVDTNMNVEPRSSSALGMTVLYCCSSCAALVSTC